MGIIERLRSLKALEVIGTVDPWFDGEIQLIRLPSCGFLANYYAFWLNNNATIISCLAAKLLIYGSL